MIDEPHAAMSSADLFHAENAPEHIAEEALTVDPIVNILSAFYCIPSDYHSDIFHDFCEAAQSQDLRRLLDTISDWAATAELYSQPDLAADLQDATGGRKEAADWLPG